MIRNVLVIHSPTMLDVDRNYKAIVETCKKYPNVHVLNRYGTKTIIIENILMIKLTDTAHIEREFRWYKSKCGMTLFETQSDYVRRVLLANGFEEVQNSIGFLQGFLRIVSIIKGGI